MVFYYSTLLSVEIWGKKKSVMKIRFSILEKENYTHILKTVSVDLK